MRCDMMLFFARFKGHEDRERRLRQEDGAGQEVLAGEVSARALGHGPGDPKFVVTRVWVNMEK